MANTMKRAWPAILIALSLPAQMREKPVALYPGLGNWRHPIATRSPEAQKYFDQGLALLYGFNRYESLRSFRKAAELDPQAAMAFWGMAMAQGPYVNMDGDPSFDLRESCAAAAKGGAIKAPKEIERLYIEAAATRCPDFADPSRYIGAMRELAARAPDDLDAQVLYAEALMVPVRWRWYSSDGKPADGVPEAERVLEAVLRRNPLHPGANHLYIHAVESSPAPERGIASAQRLMALQPAAGHVVHMPGHIWLAIGDFDNAVAVNERAAEVDRRYFAQTGVQSTYYMYYLHNLQFILHARGMQGRIAATRAVERQITDAAAPMLKMMPEMAGLFNSIVTMAELRLARWDDLIAAPQPKADNPLALTFWRYSRAVALAINGRAGEARAEQAEFEKLHQAVDRNLQWGSNKMGDVMDLAAIVLDARIQQSVSGWKRAVEMQDALAYDEPPPWYYPVRESLGAALLQSGDAPAAEAVFREGLRRSPHNGRMLFGLLESLKAQKKTDAVAVVQQEFDAAWKGADLKLQLSDL